MPAKREDATSRQHSETLRRSGRRRRHRRPRRRLARPRARAVGRSCSSAASSAPGPRASPPGCSRRSPRPTPASGRCSSSACAARGAGRRSPRARRGQRRRRRLPRRAARSMVARDRDEAEALERERDLRERFGLRRRARCCPARRAGCEPALAPTAAQRAATCPTTTPSIPRLVVRRARASPRERAGARAARRGVEVDGRRRAAAPSRSCVAAGPWSGALRRRARAVRPVKGQSLRLRDPAGPGLLRARRALAAEPGYLVPRGDGRYVLGATQEERGFDTAVTALGVHELLRDAAELVPGVLELEVEEAHRRAAPGHARQRARSSAARGATRGIVWATGHYRNGVLLAPVTADLVVAELAGEPIDARLRPRALRPRCGAAGVIVLNGEPRERDGATIVELLADLGVEERARGVAVAVNGEVVPRARVAVAPRRRRATASRRCPPCREADREHRADPDHRHAVRDRRAHAALAPDPRHRRLPAPGDAGRGDPRHARRARHRRPAAHRSGGARLARRRARRLRRRAAARTPPAASRPATPSSPRAWPARRSRPTGSSSRSSATSARCCPTRPSCCWPPRSSSPTASSSCPTRTTTRSSPAAWRTSAARRSCRSARRSARAWASATPTTSRSSSSAPACR